MTVPETTLEPGEDPVSRMASGIYTAYLSRGVVNVGDEAIWMQRSIRQAIREVDDQSNVNVSQCLGACLVTNALPLTGMA